jgi:hypothetical protein
LPEKYDIDDIASGGHEVGLISGLESLGLQYTGTDRILRCAKNVVLT